MTSPSSRIAPIVDKLAQARQRGLTCFGSDAHRFELRPPASEEAVRAFEVEHGVTLPEDFRTFLLEAGDGGAGPFYGLYPLSKWNDFADWVLDETPAGFLARPCPLAQGRNRLTRDEHDCADPSPYQGTLSLGTQGCSYIWW